MGNSSLSCKESWVLACRLTQHLALFLNGGQSKITENRKKRGHNEQHQKSGCEQTKNDTGGKTDQYLGLQVDLDEKTLDQGWVDSGLDPGIGLVDFYDGSQGRRMRGFIRLNYFPAGFCRQIGLVHRSGF